MKGEVLAPPAIDAKFIIVKTGSGELLALDKSSGEIMWSYRSKLPALTIRGSSSPVIDGNNVYATFVMEGLEFLNLTLVLYSGTVPFLM